MAAAARCLGCGADMVVGAAFCARCGRSTTPALRDLERIDAGAPAGPTAHERVVSESGAGRPRGRGIAALVAIVVLIGAIVVLLSSGGGDGGDTAAPPTSTTRPGTPNTRLVYPSSTRPGETTTSTSRPATTTSSTTTSTTLVEYLGPANTPVLGESTGGRSLYAVGDGIIRRVELDTGRVTTVSVGRGHDDFWAARLTPTALVLSGGAAVEYEIALDLQGSPQPTDRTPAYGFVIPGTADSWSVTGSAFGTLAEFRREGAVVASFPLPEGMNSVGTVADRMLIVGGGRIFTMDPEGKLRDYAPGSVVGANGAWVLSWSCDSRAQCAFHLGDADEPNAREVRVPEGTFGGEYYGGMVQSVSPAGTFAVLPGGNSGSRLVDLRDGRVVLDDTSSYGAWMWSPDERWWFRYGEQGDVWAVSTEDGHMVEVLRSVGRTQGTPRSLAVG